MKNLKIFIICSLLVFSACNEELEFKDFGEVNPSIFPASEADVEALVAAAYYPLRGGYSNGIHATAETGLIFTLDATTEILQGPYGQQQQATLHSYNPTVTTFTRYYDQFYNQISANTLSIDQIENSTLNENVKKAGIAELKCARGFLAYELFDMYGGLVIAPLEVLQNPLVDTPLARLTEQETVDFIEKDLLQAALDLPLPGEATYGRFSQGLARMLLIRLYLHQKRWEDVETQANLIIAMNHYILDEDYVGLWTTTPPIESKEIIFTVPADYAATSENQWQLMAAPNNFPDVNGFGTIQSSWQFYDSFEANDVRKTNLIAEYVGTDGVTYNRNNPANVMQLGPVPLKIGLDPRLPGLTTIDMIIYRYADVLLSKAEALANKTGVPTQESIDLINIVRERAGLNDIQLANFADIDTFNTMILLERSHEYWCENGQYRADLIRHNKYIEYADALNGVASESAPHKVLFPFSLDRISEGKGLFLQNPGYN
jgi:hypothetical protein|tara:strand:- start:661 stop:2127 length:1467 start_codon:yes stop_codon:yes gene_type:complete